MKTLRPPVFLLVLLPGFLAPSARCGEPAAPPAPAAASAPAPVPVSTAGPAPETASTAAPETGTSLAAPPGETAKSPVPPPLSPRFLQVRHRIDTLFGHRNSAPAPQDPRHNPFRPAGVFAGPAAGTTRDGTPLSEPQATDVTLLQQGVASLKIGGALERDGVMHRFVNSRLFKEGDVIQAQVQGQTVYLRIRTLTAKSITLTLNEAELTLKF